MSKQALRRRSAEIGYNLGFGAKRHFSTFDMVEDLPDYFGVLTTAIGVFFLKYPNADLSDFLSVVTIGVGLGIWHLNSYSKDKSRFIEVGKELNNLFNDTRGIFEKSQTCQESEVPALETRLDEINKRFQDISIHKQVFGSGVYAHYKLFYESQAEWFEKELGLTFWKDKFPASLKVLLLVAFVVAVISLAYCNGLFLGICNR